MKNIWCWTEGDKNLCVKSCGCLHAYPGVCMHAFCPPSRNTEVRFLFPDLPVSLACLASCELHQPSRLFARELHWFQQQHTRYFSAVPWDWEGERRSHVWNAFSGTLSSPLRHRCQFEPFFACWKSGLWFYCLPKYFLKMGNISDFLI